MPCVFMVFLPGQASLHNDGRLARLADTPSYQPSCVAIGMGCPRPEARRHSCTPGCTRSTFLMEQHVVEQHVDQYHHEPDHTDADQCRGDASTQGGDGAEDN